MITLHDPRAIEHGARAGEVALFCRPAGELQITFDDAFDALSSPERLSGSNANTASRPFVGIIAGGRDQAVLLEGLRGGLQQQANCVGVWRGFR